MSSVLARKAFLKQIGQIFLGGIIILMSRLFGDFLLRFLKTERFVKIDSKKFIDAQLTTEDFFAEKTAAGVRVFSRKCPHLGCTLQKDESRKKIVCPCHGSTFSIEGKYESGPARRNMFLLPVKQTGKGKLIIKL